MTGIVGSLPGGQGERNPEAGAGIAEGEATRENPDDREFASAHAKGAADDRRIGAKELAPEPVGEDDAGVVARLALVVGENPPVRRIDAQQTEERWRGHHAAHARRHAASLNCRSRKVVQRLLLEDRDVPEPVAVVGCRAARAASSLDERILIGHQEHAVRFGHPQRVEQHGVDGGHNRGMPAQADGQRDNRGGREPAILSSTLRAEAPVHASSVRRPEERRSQGTRASAASAPLPTAARSSASAGHEGTCAWTSRHASSRSRRAV